MRHSQHWHFPQFRCNMRKTSAKRYRRVKLVWNCLWGHELKRPPGINRKSRESYPGRGFLSSATWSSLPKEHYNGLNQTKPNNLLTEADVMHEAGYVDSIWST